MASLVLPSELLHVSELLEAEPVPVDGDAKVAEVEGLVAGVAACRRSSVLLGHGCLCS